MSGKIKLYIPTKSSFIIPPPIKQNKEQNKPIQKPTEKPLIPNTTIGAPSPNAQVPSYEIERGKAMEDFFKSKQRTQKYEQARQGKLKPTTPNDFVPKYEIERGKAIEDFFKNQQRFNAYEKMRKAGTAPKPEVSNTTIGAPFEEESKQTILKAASPYAGVLRPPTLLEKIRLEIPEINSSFKLGLASVVGVNEKNFKSVFPDDPEPSDTIEGEVAKAVGTIIGNAIAFKALSPLIGAPIADKLWKATEGLNLLNRTLARFLINGTSEAATWGIIGGSQEFFRQLLDNEHSLAKIGVEALDTATFGYVSALAGASPSLIKRLASSTLGFGVQTIISLLIRNGKITKDDIPKIATNMGIGFVTTLMDGVKVSKYLDDLDRGEYGLQETINKIQQVYPEMSKDEAKKVAETINKAYLFHAVNPENEELANVYNALKATYLMKRDVDYLVQIDSSFKEAAEKESPDKILVRILSRTTKNGLAYLNMIKGYDSKGLPFAVPTETPAKEIVLTQEDQVKIIENYVNKGGVLSIHLPKEAADKFKSEVEKFGVKVPEDVIKTPETTVGAVFKGTSEIAKETPKTPSVETPKTTKQSPFKITEIPSNKKTQFKIGDLVEEVDHQNNVIRKGEIEKAFEVNGKTFYRLKGSKDLVAENLLRPAEKPVETQKVEAPAPEVKPVETQQVSAGRTENVKDYQVKINKKIQETFGKPFEQFSEKEKRDFLTGKATLTNLDFVLDENEALKSIPPRDAGKEIVEQLKLKNKTILQVLGGDKYFTDTTFVVNDENAAAKLREQAFKQVVNYLKRKGLTEQQVRDLVNQSEPLTDEYISSLIQKVKYENTEPARFIGVRITPEMTFGIYVTPNRFDAVEMPLLKLLKQYLPDTEVRVIPPEGRGELPTFVLFDSNRKPKAILLAAHFPGLSLSRPTQDTLEFVGLNKQSSTPQTEATPSAPTSTETPETQPLQRVAVKPETKPEVKPQEEINKGKELAQKLFPDFNIVDSDDTYFYVRKDGVGAITGQLDDKGNVSKLVVEKFGEKSKIFKGKNAIERAKEYLQPTEKAQPEVQPPAETQPLQRVAVNVPDQDVIKTIKDIDIAKHYGNSVPTWDVVPELMKRFNISEEQAKQILLDLDDKELIHLQRYDNPSALPEEQRKYLIPWGDSSFGFVTIRGKLSNEPQTQTSKPLDRITDREVIKQQMIKDLQNKVLKKNMSQTALAEYIAKNKFMPFTALDVWDELTLTPEKIKKEIAELEKKLEQSHLKEVHGKRQVIRKDINETNWAKQLEALKEKLARFEAMQEGRQEPLQRVAETPKPETPQTETPKVETPKQETQQQEVKTEKNKQQELLEKQQELLQKLKGRATALNMILDHMANDLEILYSGDQENSALVKMKYGLKGNIDKMIDQLEKLKQAKEQELEQTQAQISQLQSQLGKTTSKTEQKGALKAEQKGSFEDLLDKAYEEKSQELSEKRGSITIEVPDFTATKEFFRDLLGGLKTIIEETQDMYKHLQFYPDLAMHTRNDIRLLYGRLNEIVGDKAERVYLSIYGGLNKDEAKLTGQLIKELSELGRIKAGRGNPTRTLKQQQQIVDDLMKQANDKVIKAVKTFRQLRDALTQEQIQRGLLEPDELLENYSRFYVVEYTPYLYKGVPRSLKNPVRGYLKEAKGTTKEVRTDPEAIIHQFVEVMVDNEIQDFITNLATEYDILPKLNKQQRAKIFGVDENGRIKDVVPNKIYEIDGKKYYGYTPARFKRTIFKTEEGYFAFGRYHKTYLVPEEIYQTFTHFTDRGNKFLYIMNTAVRYWKSMAILSSYPKFNINNLIGDMYFMLLQSPEPEAVIKEFDTALRWLAGVKDPYSEKLTKFINDNDVVGSTYLLTETHKGNNPIAQFLNLITKSSQIRESFLRVAYASYLYRRYEAGLADQTIAKHDWIYIDDLKKDPYHALGKIARDIEFDYAWASKTYDRLIRGGAFPLGTWYFKASWQFWRFFTRHPLKTLGFVLGIPIAAEIYNHRVHKDLEVQLPDSVRDRTHIILGQNPDGTIRVWMPQLPPDILIGSKVFSIAVGEAYKYLNGEEDIKQAAINTLKQWGVREARGIEFLLNPIIRFLTGLANDKDPYDGASIYPVNKENLTPLQLNAYRGLFFLKVIVPYLSEYAGEELLGKPADLVERKILDGLIGKGIIGVYDIDPKQAIRIGNTMVTWDDYTLMKQVAGQEIYYLTQMKNDWINSGKTPQDYIQTPNFARYMNNIKQLWINEIKDSNIWKQKTNRDDVLQKLNALSPNEVALILEQTNRLTDLFNSYYNEWLNTQRQRLINSGKTGEELDKIMKQLEQARAKKLYDTIKSLSKTSRAFGGMP